MSSSSSSSSSSMGGSLALAAATAVAFSGSLVIFSLCRAHAAHAAAEPAAHAFVVHQLATVNRRLLRASRHTIAYVLFARGEEAISRLFEEQEEDIGCDSSAAGSSTSSSDEVELADDASSSGSTTGDDHFEMGSLMTQLPIKRGLSKFFAGKSQSFASLAAVAGLEDLPKPPAKRLKTSRSCGVGLKDAHRGRLPALAAGKKQAPGARLSAPRKLVRARPLVAASPARAAAGQPLLFA